MTCGIFSEKLAFKFVIAWWTQPHISCKIFTILKHLSLPCSFQFTVCIFIVGFVIDSVNTNETESSPEKGKNQQNLNVMTPVTQLPVSRVRQSANIARELK